MVKLHSFPQKFGDVNFLQALIGQLIRVKVFKWKRVVSLRTSKYAYNYWHSPEKTNQKKKQGCKTIKKIKKTKKEQFLREHINKYTHQEICEFEFLKAASFKLFTAT